MKKRQIGTSDLQVNEIGYGAMSLSLDKERRLSEDDAIRLLQRAVDEFGLEFIDTADSYGSGEDDLHHGERLIARALAGERRQRVVVATKGGFARPGGRWVPDGRPEHLRVACEGSLRALGTDRIDLYQLHLPDPAVPIQESLGALVDMQREGKIRYIGVSNFSMQELVDARRVADIVSVQAPLWFLFMNSERAELLKYCEENRITWIAFAPVGGNRNAHRLPEFQEWFDEHIVSTDASIYSIALAWLLHRSPMLLPIPATTKIEHLAENMRASEIALSDEEVAMIPRAEAWMHHYARARHTGDFPKAIESLEKGLKFEPNDSSTWYNLSCVYALSGDPEKAFETLRHAIDIGFNDAEHLRNERDFESLRDDPRFDDIASRIAAT